MTSDLQRGGHRQHGGPQQQVGHGQVDDEVVGGDPQVSVADHGQNDQNVPHDGEHDEEGQHHAHRHRPAQVQRGGVVLGTVAAVDGGVRSAVKIPGGAVTPRTHGEEGEPGRSSKNQKQDSNIYRPLTGTWLGSAASSPRLSVGPLSEMLSPAPWGLKTQRSSRL